MSYNRKHNKDIYIYIYLCSVCPTLWPHGLYSPWTSPGQNTGVASLSILQRIFPTQGSNPRLPQCMQILYQLSYEGSPLLAAHGPYSPWNSPGQNTGVASLSLLQGILPTQELNPGSPTLQVDFYQLSHKLDRL